MAQEIERKFLVVSDEWRAGKATTIRQGYLSTERERTVRIRTREDASTGAAHAYLTIKGKTTGAARAEYEYAIPLADANEMLDTLCQRPLIEKRRYVLDHAGMTWEIDEFFGENAELIMAEIELTDEAQEFARPTWLGEEVTHDHRYFNAALAEHPYSAW